MLDIMVHRFYNTLNSQTEQVNDLIISNSGHTSNELKKFFWNAAHWDGLCRYSFRGTETCICCKPPQCLIALLYCLEWCVVGP